MYIGIDLGGTNIAVGLVDSTPKVVAKTSRPTLVGRPYMEMVKDMVEMAEELLAKEGYTKADLLGVGVGSPGSIDPATGEIIYANNLDWHHIPLDKELAKAFPGVPVAVENDANAAAYGEYVVNGKGTDSFVFITLGTGVGGGLILNKKIYTGFNGTGAELGHFSMVMDGEYCTCGRNGCWEAYASVTALIRQTKEAIEKNPDSLMAKLAEERGRISGRTAFDAADAGDEAAKQVVKTYLRYVADGIVSMINIFQPEMLVIGGGISKQGDSLLNPIKEYLMKYVYCKEVPMTEVKIATLFNDAGIIGAALASTLKK